MKNNKGFTVVELIASFALTMIITVFLFEVLIEVKDVFADTGTKTSIQQKASIISKNIQHLIPNTDTSISCTNSSNLGTCQINGQTLQIDKGNNKVVINGQNFAMPDTVNIKSFILYNSCRDTNCYLHTQMVLESGNLKQEYNYDVTYYYFSTTDYELTLKPSFAESNTDDGKTVTITFPEGCGSDYTCTYQKNDGEVINVTDITVDVPFTSNGNVIATVVDEGKNISGSYNVNGIVSLSTGEVKGGNSKLSKNKAIDDEIVSFEATPNSDFTYQGATLVCSNGTQYNISKNNKSFSIKDDDCNSATLYPSWQKKEKVIMSLNSVPANPNFTQTLTDVSGTGKYQPNDGTHKYYITINNPKGSWSRVQMSSVSTVDVTEYKYVYIDTWCNASNTTMMVGITNNRNTWMSHPQGADDKVGTHAAKGNVTTNASGNERINCDIQKYTGNWYIGVQRVYTASLDAHYCNINRIGLTGITYSYTNRGI